MLTALSDMFGRPKELRAVNRRETSRTVALILTSSRGWLAVPRGELKMVRPSELLNWMPRNPFRRCAFASAEHPGSHCSGHGHQSLARADSADKDRGRPRRSIHIADRQTGPSAYECKYDLMAYW